MGVRINKVPYEYWYFLIYEDFLYYFGGKLEINAVPLELPLPTRSPFRK